MVCIYCGSDTSVTNSRHQKRQNQVWRRRYCASCSSTFTTLEKTDLFTALSVADKNHYKPFLRDKLFLSLYDSLKHRKTALNDATALTDTIISKLMLCIKDGRVENSMIAKTALDVLNRFDKAAATSYAAYHPLEK